MPATTRHARLSLLTVLFAMACVMFFVSRALSGVARDAAGFTVVTPAGDSKVVYVSAAGNDANSGLSTSLPKATLSAAFRLLRNGFPDQMLLRRGDTWNETFPRLRISGRSVTEPILLGAYDDGTTGHLASSPRPVVVSGAGLDNNSAMEMMVGGGTTRVDHLYLQSIDVRTSVAAVYGLWWYMPASDVLVEDCSFRGFDQGIACVSSGTAQLASGVVLRRNLLYRNNADIATHPQGIYIANQAGTWTIEENIFIENGRADFFCHQVYVDESLVTGVRMNFLRNVILGWNGSSHGAQLRECRGEVAQNFVWKQAIGIQVGTGGLTQGGGTDSDPLEDLWTHCVDNVVIDSIDQSASFPKGWGIDVRWLASSTPSSISRNLIARSTGTNRNGIIFDIPGLFTRNVTLESNVIYDATGIIFQDGANYDNITLTNNAIRESSGWVPLIGHSAAATGAVFHEASNTFFSSASQASWFEVAGAGRSFAAYKSAVGDTTSTAAASAAAGFVNPALGPRDYLAAHGTSSTSEADAYDKLILLLIEQRRGNYDVRWTAVSLGDYERVAFGMAPIAGTSFNTPPIASAGPDQTVPDTDRDGIAAVTLDGSGSSDPDGSITTYAWRELLRADHALLSGSGPATSLALGAYEFSLVVTDNQGTFSPADTVLVTVSANSVVGAGSTAVVGGATLVWSGYTGASDYLVQWGFAPGVYTFAAAVSGTSIDITGTQGSTAYWIVAARALGSTGAPCAEQSVTLLTASSNVPPVANAGSDILVVDSGAGDAEVFLDGTESTDSDGTIVSYVWTTPDGGPTPMSGSEQSPVLAVGSYVYTLTVTDNQGATGTDTVFVTVREIVVNPVPAKIAGLQLFQYQNGRGLRATWTADALATGYSVTYFKAPSGIPVTAATTGTSLSVGGLVRNGTYTFVVRGTNASGQGPASDTASGKPRAARKKRQQRRRRHRQGALA